MPEETSEHRHIGTVPMLVLVALAAFGAVALVQWVLGWLFGVVKLVIFVGIIVLAIWAVARFKTRDD
jgi:hypothetical protein